MREGYRDLLRDLFIVCICCACIAGLIVGSLLISEEIDAEEGVQMGLGIALVVSSSICCCATTLYCICKYLNDYKSAWN